MQVISADVPFSYEQSFTPAGGGSVRRTLVRDHVPLDFRVGDDGDGFPEAMLVRLAGKEGWSSIRWDGVRFFQASPIFDRLDGVDGFLSALKEGRGTPLATRQRFNADIPADPVGGGWRHLDDRQEKIDQMTDVARHMVFCDGQFWTECHEPVLVLQDRSDGRWPARERWIDVKFFDPRVDLRHAGVDPVFRADEVDRLEAYLRGLDSAQPCSAQQGNAQDMKCLVPGAPTIPAASISLVGLAREVLRVAGADLSGVPAETMLAYATLRDVVGDATPESVWRGDPAPEGVPFLLVELADRMQRFCPERYASLATRARLASERLVEPRAPEPPSLVP
jgi:hypothetical protein